MGVLEPLPEDDVQALQPVIRSHNAKKLKALIEQLEPQIQGLYGPVNPRLYEVYMRALTDLAKLYRVFDPVPPREEEKDEERTAEALRAVVERQLQGLSERRQVSG